jgi:hypothetical protein
MRVANPQGAPCSLSWSDEEELLIAKIRETESVPRAEAIRRMQRRKKSSSPLDAGMEFPSARRVCRNPRCRRGDGGGPASLAHLRADARYCTATCKKAGQRSSKRPKGASDSQCLCGPKGDKSGYPLSPYPEVEHAS